MQNFLHKKCKILSEICQKFLKIPLFFLILSEIIPEFSKNFLKIIQEI